MYNNKRIITVALLVVFWGHFINAQKEVFLQKDLSKVVKFVVEKTDSFHHHSNDYELWYKYLSAPHPNVETLRLYFKQVSEEFNVPVEILMAIAQVETNWTQIGPSIDKGWGIMHLVDNNYASTLIEAANLLDLPIQRLKDSVKDNIRGMGALISYYRDKNKTYSKIEDWFDVLTKITGLYNESLSRSQVIRYYENIQKESVSRTLWNETIVIEANPKVNIDDKLSLDEDNNRSEKNFYSVDYPSAISNFIPTCNYSSRSGYNIDTWVNHWIGTGTYAGAISWFHNCESQVSAHFVIRSSDGEITQCVSVADKAWHTGAVGYPNNQRSIGVEHEATLSNPDQWNSYAMLNESTQMARFFSDEYDIPQTRSLPGIRGHGEMPGKTTDCPGTLPWGTYMHFLSLQTLSPSEDLQVDNLPIYLDWSSQGESTAQYRIQISKSIAGWTQENGFTESMSSSASVPVNINTGEVSHYYWDNNSAFAPDSNTSYYWSVKLISDGVSSYYTQPKLFSFGESSSVSNISDSKKNVVSFPNPVVDLLYVTVNNVKINSFTICDLKGQEYKSQVLNKDAEKQAYSFCILVNDLQSGIYIIKLIDNEEQEYDQKFIKR